MSLSNNNPGNNSGYTPQKPNTPTPAPEQSEQEKAKAERQRLFEEDMKRAQEDFKVERYDKFEYSNASR